MKTLIFTFTRAILILASTILAAYAGCTYNGQSYPTGSQIGPYTCMPNGTWH